MDLEPQRLMKPSSRHWNNQRETLHSCDTFVTFTFRLVAQINMVGNNNGRYLIWFNETRRFLRQPELKAIVPRPTLEAALSYHT